MATLTYTITLLDATTLASMPLANVVTRTRGFDLGTMFIAPYITLLSAGGGDAPPTSLEYHWS